MADYTYPEDRTGVRASNLITGEQHVLTPDNHRNFHFIVPKFAPFYAGSVKLFKSINGTLLELKEGIDYHYSLEFVSASLSTGKAVYGGISFVDLNLEGTIVLQQYRTVGGQWTLNTQEMLESIANIVFNPRKLTWDQINGRPTTFGPTDHTFDFNNLLTEKQIGDKLTDIRNAILTGAQSNTDHENRMDNPHNVSAIQLGVGSFYQKGIATIAEALAGSDPDKVITASVLKAVLESLGVLDLSNAVMDFNNHLLRVDNPHSVISQQMDLDLVENLEVANLSDVLSKRKIRKYVTLDNLIDYIRIHGCATADEDKRKYPVKDSLLSSYCKVRDNMGIYADGYGGTYEKIIENNSASCGYVAPPSSPQHAQKGTILTRYCIGTEQHGLYADGYGGTYSNFIAMNSPACGYTGEGGGTTYPPPGTILGQYCDGTTQVQTKANGSGGSYEDRVMNSAACTSNTTYPANGTLMSTFCEGNNQMGRYADGKGQTYNAVVQVNSTQCGYIAPTPPPTNPPVTLPPTTPGPTPPPANTPAISYQVTQSPINVGTWDANYVTLTGFRANQQYSVQFWFQGPGQYNGVATITATVGGTCDSSGRAVIDKGVSSAGQVTAGNYDCWVVETSTGVQSARQVKQYGDGIRLKIETSKSFAKAGDTYRITLSITGGKPSYAYGITVYERGSFGTRTKTSRTISTNVSGNGSDYFDTYYDGSNSYSGSVFMWGEDVGAAAKSSEITVSFTPNSVSPPVNTPAPTPPTGTPPSGGTLTAWVGKAGYSATDAEMSRTDLSTATSFRYYTGGNPQGVQVNVQFEMLNTAGNMILYTRNIENRVSGAYGTTYNDFYLATSAALVGDRTMLPFNGEVLMRIKATRYSDGMVSYSPNYRVKVIPSQWYIDSDAGGGA